MQPSPITPEVIAMFEKLLNDAPGREWKETWEPNTACEFGIMATYSTGSVREVMMDDPATIALVCAAVTWLPSFLEYVKTKGESKLVRESIR